MSFWGLATAPPPPDDAPPGLGELTDVIEEARAHTPKIDEVRVRDQAELRLLAPRQKHHDDLPSYARWTFAFGIPVFLDGEVPEGFVRCYLRGELVDEVRVAGGDTGV